MGHPCILGLVKGDMHVRDELVRPKRGASSGPMAYFSGLHSLMEGAMQALVEPRPRAATKADVPEVAALISALQRIPVLQLLQSTVEGDVP